SPKEERAGVRRPIKSAKNQTQAIHPRPNIANDSEKLSPLTPALSPLGGEREKTSRAHICKFFDVHLPSSANRFLISLINNPLVCSAVMFELLITLAPKAIISGAAARWLSR